MATSQLEPSSHDTALCIIPHRSLWPRIDRLRSRHDKAYEKWPPHVNLIYPFVQVDALSRAVEAVQSAVNTSELRPFQTSLNSAGVFEHRHDNTIFIQDGVESNALTGLRRAVLKALGQEDVGDHQMHMTIGQSETSDGPWHHSLLQKAKWLPTVEWMVEGLHVLVRERTSTGGSEMKAWATVSLIDGSIDRHEPPKPFYRESQPEAWDEHDGLPYSHVEGDRWEKRLFDGHATPPSAETAATLTVASYNVLADFSHPPSQKRYPLIIKNILSDRAKTDVLVLEEVTDDFLSYLLRDEDIQNKFPFCSWGPPDQENVEPLPRHTNIVVLSNRLFEWKAFLLNREHGDAVVLKFQTIGQWDDHEFKPLILAGVHLTPGVEDSSMTAKKSEVQVVLDHLTKTYPEHPTILTGDFNIMTSSYTIKHALEKDAVSPQAAAHLRDFNRTLHEDGFVDTWVASHLEKGADSSDVLETAFEGEQGATYDPTANALATELAESGCNMRPQRYDRILVKSDDYFKILHFNKFGFLTETSQEEGKDVILHASDHWGVRAVLKLGQEPESGEVAGIDAHVAPVQLKTAQGSLEDSVALLDTLNQLKSIPSVEEIDKRASAFKLLESVILDSSTPTEPARSSPPLVITPVGSYGLGVWDASSDIVCVCIGSFSSLIFFSLASQRLRKASDKGLRVMRKVKVHTYTTLELDVQGIKVDLQYAPAYAIAKHWPDSLALPVSSPSWPFQTQSLSRLKPVRDLDYVRRSVPDISIFRLAHRVIKAWAKNRGIYAAKYGCLDGSQITVLLARVYKLLAHEATVVSVPDLLATFFNHYANFDWKTDIAFDPFFQPQPLYSRPDWEPMVILSDFPPSSNTCAAASVSSVRTVTGEFQRADRLFCEEGTTWPHLLADGTAEFLREFRRYIKVDVQFWGISATKGHNLVGWLRSQCVSLLADLDRRLPELHVRFWPALYVEKTGDATEDDDPGSYRGSYLIGIDRPQEAVIDEKVTYDKLVSILERFVEQVRVGSNYYDDRTSLVAASVVKAAEVKFLEVDHREWGKYTPGDDASDGEEDENDGAQNPSVYEDYHSAHASAKKGRTTNSPRSVVVTKPEGAGKFRTAADVLNRLRWDPTQDSGDYVVGYEDRFAGAMEKGLDTWKSEQTHEEFIPQHRILYFKRKSDGVVVWDRMKRTDLLFGSGGPSV